MQDAREWTVKNWPLLDKCEMLSSEVVHVTYGRICELMDLFAAEAVRAEREGNHWIPVTERMPKQYDSALITHTDTSDGSPTVEEAQWDGETWVLARTGGYGESFYLNEQVVAWMQIPEPFRARGEKGESRGA